MRREHVVIGSAILLLLLSGCLAPDSEDALTAGGLADDNAWIASALQAEENVTVDPGTLHLMAIIGFEATNRSDIGYPALDPYLNQRLEAITDDTLGDGQAGLWIHLYHDGGTDSWIAAHRSAADRGVTMRDMPGQISPYLAQFNDAEPLAEGWLDSHDATRSAAAREAGWENATQDGGSTLMVLHQRPAQDAPYWALRHTTSDGATTTTVVLDAASGATLDPADAFGYLAVAEGSETVLLTPAGTEDVSITVASGHSGLAVRVVPSQAANPAAHVHASLLDPSGTDVGIDDTTWGSDGHITARVTDAAPGAWTLRMGTYSEMDAANLVDEVLVTWCTDGARLDPIGLAPEPAMCLE